MAADAKAVGDTINEVIENKQSKPFYVTIISNGDATGASDCTYEEIVDYYSQGIPVYCLLISDSGEVLRMPVILEEEDQPKVWGTIDKNSGAMICINFTSEEEVLITTRNAVVFVNVTENEDGTYSMDKTPEEMATAFKNSALFARVVYSDSERILPIVDGNPEFEHYYFEAPFGDKHAFINIIGDTASFGVADNKAENPYNLIINGVSYNGSEEKTVDIPVVYDWAKASTKPTYTASEVGADAIGTASNLVSVHNTATDSHSDIREAISNKLNSSELPTAINTALAQAKANGEFDGKDGTSITVKSVSESTADGGSNVVTFSDGKTLTIKNGSKGSTGATGVTGPAGPAGKTPIKGTDYWTEDDQETIIQRVLTELGAIPVFGMVDENNNIILTAVLADGTYQLKYADADGNVTDICTYNHNYAPAPDVPDVPDVPTPTYTNVLPLAKGEDGNPYNGTGYAVGKRINSSWNETNVSVTTATNPVFLTGRIPIPAGATVRFKNCYIDTNGVNGSMNDAADKAYYGHGLSGLYGCMLYYNPTSGTGNKSGTNYTWNNFVSYSNLASAPAVDSNGYVTEFTFNTTETMYARFVLGGDPTTAVITINEPITD